MPSHLLVLSLLVALLVVVSCGPGSDHGWGYDENNGPDTWQGKCQNHLKQSPIDIRAPDVDYALLHRMHFLNYDMDGKIELSNTGRTLFAGGFESWQHKQPMIQGGGLKHRYKLAQFHLHWGQNDAVGSEHAMGSLHYPAELHLVHVREGLTLKEALSRPDGLAVVGVFLAKTNDPVANKFSPISERLHDLRHSGNKTELKNFRTKYVLPLDTEAFYRYEGSLTTPLKMYSEPARQTTWKEKLSQLNHENMSYNAHNKRSSRQRGNSYRLPQQNIPPPSHHQSSQVMRGFQNAPFQMQPHYNNERKPQSRRNDTMRASKSAYAAATAPVKKHVRPANEQHMRKLNDLLRPFSYGSDDLYEETQPFVKETSLANVDIQICQTRPKVPPGKMWIFESRTIYDENGNCVSAREGAMEVSLASRMHNEPIVIVSMNDSMCF